MENGETNKKSNVIPFRPRKKQEIQPALSRDEFLRMFLDSDYREYMYEQFDYKLENDNNQNND